MTKLSNVKGRITYISSHAKQENLYAVYETTERKFWRELAKCNQEEFVKSGTEGLNQVLNNLREQIYRYRVEYLKDEDTRKVLVKEHEEIYRAIKERDVKRAQEISYRHIENQREAIIRSIREEAANQEKSGNRK